MDFFGLGPDEVRELHADPAAKSPSLHAYLKLNEQLRLLLSSRPVALDPRAHIDFVTRVVRRPLHPSAFYPLRAWLAYWSVHSLELLLPAGDGEFWTSCLDASEMIDTVAQLQYVGDDYRARFGMEGVRGFAGAPRCLPHLASTYAAISTLCILGSLDHAAYNVIDVKGLARFIHASYVPAEGSFAVCINGEQDLRGTYCALAASSLCGILDDVLAFTGPAVLDYIVQCQCAHEGGFGPRPRSEAHAGYTYCAAAALELVSGARPAWKCWQRVNVPMLKTFLVNRQDPLSGGMSGRTNKLVDGCYGFWVLGAMNIVGMQLEELNAGALRKFLLNVCACQGSNGRNVEADGSDGDHNIRGGFRDKPGKAPDLYHTCYCLSALSLLGNERVNDQLAPAFNIRSQSVLYMQKHFSHK